ncbi:MAG: NAD(P)H-quinone oxidoreductase, partial [Actinomycetes bacterium]
MKAVVITRPGGPEVLTWAEVPDPVPGPGEVLIQVVAAGVNRADLLQRQGQYPPPPDCPPYPGLECSGHVIGLGPEVTGVSIGDPVVALLSGGGYAEQVVAPITQVLPAPVGVDLVDAAGLPEVVATVWSNVFTLAALRPDEHVLVHGGASGVGTMAIQLASVLGATVLTTAGSAERLERCRSLGAAVGIDHHVQDFVEVVHQVTGGRGVDVILDNMGAAYLARNIAALAANGRLVVIGLQGGARAELDLGVLLSKRAAVLATSLRARPAAEKAAIMASVREHVWPLLRDGRVHPVIDRKHTM